MTTHSAIDAMLGPDSSGGPASAGYSLVELLVAMVIGLLILLGVIQVFNASSASYRLNDAQVRVQEAGRYAGQLIARDLRALRSGGCGSVAMDWYRTPPSLEVQACALLTGSGCSGTAAIGPTRALGYSASQSTGSNWLSDLPGTSGTGARKAVADHWVTGDVLVTWGGVGRGLYAARNSPGKVRTNPVTLAATVDEAETVGLTRGRLALITDCRNGDLFAITNPAGGGGAGSAAVLQHGASANRDAALGHVYNVAATLADVSNASGPSTFRAVVFPFDLRVYFICCVDRDTGEAGSKASDIDQCRPTADAYSPQTHRPALCQWSASTAKIRALVLDIADLRATYDGSLDLMSQSCTVDKAPGKTRLIDDAAATETTDAAWIMSKKCWDRVDTVRVSLLAVSSEELASGSARDYATGTELGAYLPADRRLYEAVQFNVATRATSPW